MMMRTLVTIMMMIILTTMIIANVCTYNDVSFSFHRILFFRDIYYLQNNFILVEVFSAQFTRQVL